MMLNRKGDSRHIGLIPKCTENASEVSPLIIVFVVDFGSCFYQVNFFSIVVLLRLFLMDVN